MIYSTTAWVSITVSAKRTITQMPVGKLMQRLLQKNCMVQKDSNMLEMSELIIIQKLPCSWWSVSVLLEGCSAAWIISWLLKITENPLKLLGLSEDFQIFWGLYAEQLYYLPNSPRITMPAWTRPMFVPNNLVYYTWWLYMQDFQRWA